MTDNCSTPNRECPFDAETIKSLGKLEEKIDNVHAAVTNGSGLTQRMARAEEFISELKGGIKTLRMTVTVIGVVLILLQIVVILREKVMP